jgi:hypothetical protein
MVDIISKEPDAFVVLAKETQGQYFSSEVLNASMLLSLIIQSASALQAAAARENVLVELYNIEKAEGIDPSCLRQEIQQEPSYRDTSDSTSNIQDSSALESMASDAPHEQSER